MGASNPILSGGYAQGISSILERKLGRAFVIKVTILYPKTEGSRFDIDYYLGTHMPMSITLLGPAMEAITVERVVSPGAPWPDAAYHAITCFVCSSREVYEQAFFPHMETLQADMPNYTDIPAIIQVSEIALEK
jgi:uncharacterized protein (TIGR02118 family)